MSKKIYICCVILLLCTCTTIKNTAYNDYKYSIDVVIPENAYLPSIEVNINNKNYYANYQTWHKQNIISKRILNEIGIDNIEGKTDVIIPQIILSNGIRLNNVNFDIKEFEDEIVQIVFGLSAFNEYNVLISQKQNKIFLYNAEELPNYLNSWVKPEIVNPEKGLYMNGGVKGSSKTYLFCLANDYGLYVGGIFNRHYNIVLNNNVPITIFLPDTIIISGKKYKNLYLYKLWSDEIKEENNLKNTSTDIILGYDFLKKYDVFIDANNMKLYIEKP
jgi:hypothetical protein